MKLMYEQYNIVIYYRSPLLKSIYGVIYGCLKNIKPFSRDLPSSSRTFLAVKPKQFSLHLDEIIDRLKYVPPIDRLKYLDAFFNDEEERDDPL